MSIEDFINQRGITSLYHFTLVKNLDSILKNGLLSREKLEKEKIRYYYNDELRLEKKLNATCVSISFPNYKMFYKYRQQESDYKWCVIELKPNILYEKNCLFCVTNAARNNETVKSDKEKKGVNALESLFYDDAYMLQVGLVRELPTNPQAEVLVLDDIEPRYIRSINFNTKKVEFPINDYPYFKFWYDPDLFCPRSDWRNWQN